jgi:L,D-transpeptidase YcbB
MAISILAKFNRSARARSARAMKPVLAAAVTLAVLAGLPAMAENVGGVSLFGKKPLVARQSGNAHNSAPIGKAVTTTEIVAGGAVSPFVATSSATDMQAALDRYMAVKAAGGWGTINIIGRLKKGSQGKSVEALNRRLFQEGYLRKEATEGEFAAVYTSATEDAVSRFQRNHGLAATGTMDTATVKELNVSVDQRIATIKANLPRLAEYSKDLGERYVVVNVPAMQIETVNAGKVFSIHNAIVGRPSRPTPVVQTALATVKFNPYWNAPPSIIEKDIIPRMLSGGPSRVLRDMNITVFKGVGGPEVDPDTVNWRSAVADDYHFRQDPGGDNAMATAKIEFLSPFGIYLHDTPDRQLFAGGMRFLSSGCVRVDKVAILINWILQGQDGIDEARIADLAKTQERLDVKIANPPQLRVAYLTAWPTANGEVNFRPDIYKMDGSGFIVGQPLDVEDRSGQRFVLKPLPRTASAVDADEATGFSLFRWTPSKRLTNATSTSTKPKAGSGAPSLFASTKSVTQPAAGTKTATKTKTKTFFMSSAEAAKAKKAADAKAKKAAGKKPASKTAAGSKTTTTGAKAKTAAKSADGKTVAAKATGTKTAGAKASTKASGKPTAKTAAKASDPAIDTKAASTKATGSKPDTTAKPADQCKADSTGKLPAGCKPKTAAKPKPQAEAQATEPTTVAN